MGQPRLLEDTSKLAKKPPTEKGWFQQEVSSGLFGYLSLPHSRQNLQSSNHLSAEACTVSWGSGGDAEVQ